MSHESISSSIYCRAKACIMHFSSTFVLYFIHFNVIQLQVHIQSVVVNIAISGELNKNKKYRNNIQHQWQTVASGIFRLSYTFLLNSIQFVSTATYCILLYIILIAAIRATQQYTTFLIICCVVSLVNWLKY